MKTQSVEGGRIFVDHGSDKGIVSKIYKELLRFNNNKNPPHLSTQVNWDSLVPMQRVMQELNVLTYKAQRAMPGIGLVNNSYIIK